MLAKSSLIVITLGACACTLLAMRQQRLQTASELAHAQLRINALDERFYAVRAKIAARTTPQEVERMAAELGPMRPINLPGDQPEPEVAENETGTPGSRATPSENATPRSSVARGTPAAPKRRRL